MGVCSDLCAVLWGVLLLLYLLLWGEGGRGGGSLGFISLFVLSDVLFRRFVLWAGLVVFQVAGSGFCVLLGWRGFRFFAWELGVREQ